MALGTNTNTRIWFEDLSFGAAPIELPIAAALRKRGTDTMLIAGSVKDLMAALHFTSGVQVTGESLAVIRLEQDGDISDGKFWDGVAWRASLIAPTAIHTEAGIHLYELASAATTGRSGATIHFTFTDNPDESGANTVCAGGEHLVRTVIEGLTVPQDARIPATLVGGAMDSDVSNIQSGVIDADSIAADAIGSSELATSAVNEIRDSILSDSTPFPGASITEVRLAELDAANIPTDLSNIQSDTDDIQTRLPAALVSGRMDSDVGNMQTDTLDAAALATDAVNEIQSGLATQASVDAIQNVTRVAITCPILLIPPTGSVDYDLIFNMFDTAGNPEDPDGPDIIDVTVNNQGGTSRNANLGGSPTGRMSKVGVGRYDLTYTVDSSHLVEQLIFHYAYDENAISFVQDRTCMAVTQIDESFTGVDRTVLNSIQTDTDDIQTRIPALLVGGRMDSDVGNMQTDVVDANAFAADAVTEIDTALTSAHGTGSWQTSTVDATGISAAVWGALRVDHTGVGTFGEFVNVDEDAIRLEIMSHVIEGNTFGFTVEETLNLLRKIQFNRLQLKDGDTDNLQLYDDNGTTIIFEWDSTDKKGNAIVIPELGPARRGPLGTP